MIKIIDGFKDKKIAVIGDLILDKYIFGKVERISPEAPIPIVTVKSEKFVPGGAANVASNIATLSGKAEILGVVGKDVASKILIDGLSELNIETAGICNLSDRKTIEKIRIIGQNQQLLRVDYEDDSYIGTHIETELINNLEKIENLSVIIISDYAKGTITAELMLMLKKFAKAKEIKLIVDPKPKHKDIYHGVFLITPNQKEAQELSGILLKNDEDFIVAGRKLVSELQANIIITAGEKGMYVFDAQDELKVNHIHTVAKEVYDVSGAGDTVIATLSLAIACGANLSDAATLANIAAGIKVSKMGTAPVYLEELKSQLR